MNRAARRAGNKPKRITHFQAAHIRRLEQGYDSHAFATVANRETPPQIVEEEAAKARAAWLLLSGGKPAPHDMQATAWKRLAQVCNITRHRANQIAEASLAELHSSTKAALMLVTLSCAEDALRRMQQRGEAGGNYTSNATDHLLIDDMLDLYQQILALSTTLQMQRALEAVLAAQINPKKPAQPLQNLREQLSN